MELKKERDGKEILLYSKKYASEYHWISLWHLFSTLAVFGAFVALVIAFDSLLIRIPASLLLGLSMIRIFILYHDSEHGTIFRSAPFARVLLQIYGVLVLNPPNIWRRSHDHHHRHNAQIYGASIGSYPVMTRRAYNRAGRGEKIAYIISRHPLTITLGYLTVFLWGMCIRSLIVNPKTHWDSGLSIVLHFTMLGTLLFFNPTLALFLIIIPMVLASALGAYLFYAQHNFPNVKLRSREDWDYNFAALHSSSYIRMGPLMNWFTGNIGYHHVHHLNARIPFYRLPEGMAGMEELQSPTETSLSLKDVRDCFKLKLWDPDSNEMVSFEEHKKTLDKLLTQ